MLLPPDLPVLTASFPKVYATVDLGLQGTSLRRHLRRLAHRLSRPPLSAPSAVPSVRRVPCQSGCRSCARVTGVGRVGRYAHILQRDCPASQPEAQSRVHGVENLRERPLEHVCVWCSDCVSSTIYMVFRFFPSWTVGGIGTLQSGQCMLQSCLGGALFRPDMDRAGECLDMRAGEAVRALHSTHSMPYCRAVTCIQARTHVQSTQLSVRTRDR